MLPLGETVMKILQVIPYFCFGGAETMCENLCYALRAQGHQVAVVSLYGERTPISRRMEEKGIRIRYLDKKLGLDLSMVPKLVRIMKTEKPDVVHTHLDVIKYAVAAARLAGVPKCVHTVHNVAQKEAEGRIQKAINGFYFRRGWSVPVALSPEVQTSIVSFYGLKREQVPVAYNGVDLRRCLPKEDYQTGENFRILHIGRFNEQKNHELLLRVFQKLARKQPNLRLDLIGDGELRQEMEGKAEDLGIQERVSFLGSQSDVYPYLHDADLFLLPSKYEGMPMTLIEAMGTGLPIVATAVGGVPDMLETGVDGFVVPCEEEKILEACEGLIRDEELRERFGRAARVNADRFSAQTMGKRYLEIYKG